MSTIMAFVPSLCYHCCCSCSWPVDLLACGMSGNHFASDRHQIPYADNSRILFYSWLCMVVSVVWRRRRQLEWWCRGHGSNNENRGGDTVCFDDTHKNRSNGCRRLSTGIYLHTGSNNKPLEMILKLHDDARTLHKIDSTHHGWHEINGAPWSPRDKEY